MAALRAGQLGQCGPIPSIPDVYISVVRALHARLCRLAVHSEDTQRLGRENDTLRAQVTAAHEAATSGLDMYKVRTCTSRQKR